MEIVDKIANLLEKKTHENSKIIIEGKRGKAFQRFEISRSKFLKFSIALLITIHRYVFYRFYSCLPIQLIESRFEE